jgi:hypothetical protein
MEESQLTELPMGTPEQLSAQITAESGLEVFEGVGGDGAGQSAINLQADARAAAKQAQGP